MTQMNLTANAERVSAKPSKPIYVCTICQDCGRVHPRCNDGTVDYGRVVPCKCRDKAYQEERAVMLKQQCKLPFLADRMTFHTFVDTDNLDLITAYNTALALAQETEDVRWLTLLGAVGRGKTHLALAACHEWLRRGKPARYAFVPLLLKELRDGFNNQGEQSYTAQLDYFCTIPLLVLDDLGVEAPTPWAQEQLQTIIHSRWLNALPLIVTTNKPLDALVGDSDHRIGSRLQREAWCRVVNIEAPEHRNVE